MAITTTTSLPAAVQQSFSQKLLSVATPNLIHKIPAVLKSMPAKSGTTMVMRRYSPITPSVVPLGNSGVTPPASQLTAVDIQAKISFYGQYVILNEQVVLQNNDPTLNEAVARLGVSMRQSEDMLTRDMLKASAASVNAVGGVNGKLVAVIKSFLIDLDILTGSAEDDRAQASLCWAA